MITRRSDASSSTACARSCTTARASARRARTETVVQTFARTSRRRGLGVPGTAGARSQARCLCFAASSGRCLDSILWDFAHHGTARDARRLRPRREGARAPVGQAATGPTSTSRARAFKRRTSDLAWRCGSRRHQAAFDSVSPIPRSRPRTEPRREARRRGLQRTGATCSGSRPRGVPSSRRLAVGCRAVLPRRPGRRCRASLEVLRAISRAQARFACVCETVERSAGRLASHPGGTRPAPHRTPGVTELPLRCRALLRPPQSFTRSESKSFFGR